jgi:hypothetical protein
MHEAVPLVRTCYAHDAQGWQTVIDEGRKGPQREGRFRSIPR